MNVRGPITASIVSHGHGPTVEAFLADLARIDSPHVAEVVLTLNVPEASDFAPPPMPMPLRIIENRAPRGFGANHNAAFACASGNRFAILNPDLRLDEDPFGPLLEALDRPEIALAAPRVVDQRGRTAPSGRGLYTPLEIASRLWRDPGVADEPEWVAGMFMVVRAEVFASIGGFDERYFLYIEDVDLCTRLRVAGWRLAYVPCVAVTHAAQHASHRSLRHLRWHAAGMLRYWTSSGFRSRLALRDRAAR